MNKLFIAGLSGIAFALSACSGSDEKTETTPPAATPPAASDTMAPSTTAPDAGTTTPAPAN